MKYNRIIIGGGASGLYFAAACPGEKSLLLERCASPGNKLLLCGGGQCNLTHGGSIKDFIGHYGPGGRKIRSALYRASNLQLMDFFAEQGLSLTERPDGKIFPESMEAAQVLETLLRLIRKNGWEIKTECPVDSLEVQEDGTYLVNGQFEANQVIVAAGGCSYPATGSDGSIFPILENLGFSVVPPKPALVPITVQDYPFGELSGISFRQIPVQIGKHQLKDDLLLTHSSFSGPAVLNLSRYAMPGNVLKINYIPDFSEGLKTAGDRRRAETFFSEELKLPKRFISVMLKRAGIDPAVKTASLSGKETKRLLSLLSCDSYSISGTSGFGSAMATAGGVSLDEIDLKTFESKKHPGLFIIGETLDIDGDTGGYNLQFAFSSGCCAAKSV